MDFKTLREQRGFSTQRQLADEAGVKVTTINQIERGLVRDPRWSTMSKLVKVLRADPADIADAIADTNRLLDQVSA